MLRKHLCILLSGMVLFSSVRVEGQLSMPDNVCSGQFRHYTVNSNPGSAYTWSIDGAVQPGFTSNEFFHIWNTSGTYLLEVQERSADGCPGPVRSGQVFVHPLPSLTASGVNSVSQSEYGKIDFTFTDVPDGTYTITYASGSFTNVIVLDGIATVTAPPGLFDDLSITVAGCMSSASANIVISYPEQLNLVIPEAFSPNGDLVNDVWNIGNIDLYPYAEVTIYNRWGQTVWKSEQGYHLPWDGKSNGINLPVDSYHYVINLHNRSKPIVGEITIVR
ncbi:MAG: gliding motility-associated C-terminal domain-containing protein [Bacteroidales bacterium]